MMALSAAGLFMAAAANPAAAPSSAVAFPAGLPADCVTTSQPSPITQGQAVRMPGQDVTQFNGRRACDQFGNMAVITGGVLGPITSYLAPPPVPTLASSTDSTTQQGEIAGIIAGCSIFGGFVSLFAGGVFLAVRRSYRVNPDPSVTWAGPPLMLAGADPSVRDQLEGLYAGSPGMYPQGPMETGLRPDLRPNSRPAETSPRRPAETVETPKHGAWDDWGEPTQPERFDIAGMALAEFKAEHDPHGGDFQAMNLAYPDMASVAQRRLFDYVMTYGAVNPRCAVWSVFGLTHKSGDTPSAKEYQKAADWVRSQFANEDFMPF